MLELVTLPVAAIGLSIIYLLMGGGIGAAVIFVVAKLLGQ